MSKTIGRDAWATLDSLAATFDASKAEEYKLILKLLPSVYPCSECRHDMVSIIETHTQNGSFESGEAFAVLIYDLHDKVNRKLRDLERRRFMETLDPANHLSQIVLKVADAVDPHAPYNKSLGPRKSIPRDIYISKLCLLTYEANKDHVWRFCEALIESKNESKHHEVVRIVNLIIYRIFGFQVPESESIDVPSFRLFRTKTRVNQIRSAMEKSSNNSEFLAMVLRMKDNGTLL